MKILKFIPLILLMCYSSCSSDDSNDVQLPQATPCDIQSLQFTQVLDFNSAGNCINNGSNGATMDTTNKIIYFVNRGATGQPQELIRINLNNNSVSTHSGGPSDMCTTRPLFFNNNVFVAGVSRTSNYQTSGTFSGAVAYPSIIGNWFDIAVNNSNNQLYFCGVRTNLTDMVGTGDIKTYNSSSNTFATIGNIGNPITRAAIEYHGGHLYIFGGYADDLLQNPLGQMYKYNLSNNTTNTISLPNGGVNSGYLCSSGSCLFGSGLQQGSTTNITFYKYNTSSSTITSLTHNLSGQILGMTSSDNKIYVILKAAATGQYSLFMANLI